MLLIENETKNRGGVLTVDLELYNLELLKWHFCIHTSRLYQIVEKHLLKFGIGYRAKLEDKKRFNIMKREIELKASCVSLFASV